LINWHNQEDLNIGITHHRVMPYSNPMPFVGMTIQETDYASLIKNAQKHRLSRTETARAAFRLGLQLLQTEHDSSEIMKLAKVEI